MACEGLGDSCEHFGVCGYVMVRGGDAIVYRPWKLWLGGMALGTFSCLNGNCEVLGLVIVDEDTLTIILGDS
jgi:hypothetical protein